MSIGSKGISWLLTASLLLFPVAFAGCSGKVVMPPVTGDAAMLHLTGKFIWFDLHTPDVIASQRFYSAVFDWAFERTDPDSGKIKTILFNDMRIGNVMQYEMTEMGPAHWVAYISVPDVQAASELALERGAKSVRSPQEMPDRGTVAEMVDPTGATFGLLTSPVGDPPDKKLMDGYWICPELRTTDVDKSITFYAKLGGYTVHEVSIDDGRMLLLKSSDIPRASVKLLGRQCNGSLWVPFVSVKDIQKTLERATEHGGRVLLKPNMNTRIGRAAIILEPAGSIIGVREYEEPF